MRRYDDMKLLATFHHGRTYGYPIGFLAQEGITDRMRKTWDLFDPAYNDFYWGEETRDPEDFAAEWKAKITEVVDAGDLQPSKTHYWRVDAVRDFGTIKGKTWSFTTTRQSRAN